MDTVPEDAQYVKQELWRRRLEEMPDWELTYELIIVVMDQMILLKKKLSAMKPGEHKQAEQRVEEVRQAVVARMRGGGRHEH